MFGIVLLFAYMYAPKLSYQLYELMSPSSLKEKPSGLNEDKGCKKVPNKDLYELNRCAKFISTVLHLISFLHQSMRQKGHFKTIATSTTPLSGLEDSNHNRFINK